MTLLEEKVFTIKQQHPQTILDLRMSFAVKYPDAMAALKLIDFERSKPKRQKGFNLVKRESKKFGIRYYVRYSHNGKILPTKWNTHTGDLDTAKQYAIANKARLVERYLSRKDAKIYTLLESFYDNNPETKAYSRNISDKHRKENHSLIVKHFLPFLKKEKITCFEQITKKTICDFQDYLLGCDMKPQTINNRMKALKNIFAYAVRKGMIDNNPGEQIKGVEVHQNDRSIRGCYELDKVKDVFREVWEEEQFYLLNLLVYTTGMRNSEIHRLKPGDIIFVEDSRFIQINYSKTQSGIRIVPLHDFVYEKLMAWAEKNKIETKFFDFRSTIHFMHASSCLGRHLGLTEEQLKAENITFYSGRHFFKTLMSREGLGEDIEEVFMGHKVSANVRKLYNHRDKVGKERIAEKAKQVFSILDRCLFGKEER